MNIQTWVGKSIMGRAVPVPPKSGARSGWGLVLGLALIFLQACGGAPSVSENASCEAMGTLRSFGALTGLTVTEQNELRAELYQDFQRAQNLKPDSDVDPVTLYPCEW